MKTIRHTKIFDLNLRLVEKDKTFIGLIFTNKAGRRLQIQGESADEIWQRLHDEAAKLSPRYKKEKLHAETYWNQHRVAEVMQPFKVIAQSVNNNERTAYTEAGGKKIGRAPDDPDRQWIDTYSAIKSAGTNAVFVCYVKNPGDEPQFQLILDGDPVRTFSADQLSDAEREWQAIARSLAP